MSSLYAVIATGGKQYRVAEGGEITVEQLAGVPGEKIDLSAVLLLKTDKGLKIGTPTVRGAKVQVQVLAQEKEPRLVVFKKKRRKGYAKKQGHRQRATRLKVLKIQVGRGAASKDKE